MRDWPEKFVYVCSAGEAAIVNALPLVHAGPERVVAAFVLCGVKDRDRATSTERTQAVVSADRLAALIENWCPGRPVEVLYGDPNSVSDWSHRMPEILAFKNGDFPIVLNLTGGRKQMALGALLGCSRAAKTPPHFIFVGGGPLGIDFIDQEGTQSTARVHGELDISEYLNLYGLSRRTPELSRRKHQSHEEAADAVEQFSGIILKDAASLQAIISDSIKPRLSADGKIFNAGLVDPWFSKKGSNRQKKRVGDALKCLVGVDGLTSAVNENDQTVLHAARREGVDLLNGGWIEALLYNKLREHFHDRPDVRILPNVEVGYPEGDEIIGEIDIAILFKSQLHVIETKVAHFGSTQNGASAKALAQIDKWKRLMLGQFGRVILVQPRQTQQNPPLAKGSFLSRALAAGADLALGPGAIEDAVALVERLSRQ